MFEAKSIARSIVGCCLLACAATFATAQEAAPAKPAVGTVVPPGQVYGKLMSMLEKEIVSAAEAMPEDKYNFSPAESMGEFKGVRSYSEQVKHIAESNYYFFADEETAKAKEAEIEKLKTKTEIVQALKDSYAFAHQSIDGITAENAFITTEHGTKGGMAAFCIAHMMDHYGQMVEYLRMNSIIPPASRGN
ncbi:MAG: DinB family protein [Acidobacteriota bacterium]|nr:DinB family protein [Acidobacteriota bacterium]